jgi:hypothetical protein
MNKPEFINQVKEVVMNSNLKYSPTDIKVFFHELKDSFHRNGTITDSQVEKWILTKRELNSIMKLTKDKK